MHKLPIDPPAGFSPLSVIAVVSFLCLAIAAANWLAKGDDEWFDRLGMLPEDWDDGLGDCGQGVGGPGVDGDRVGGDRVDGDEGERI